MDEWGWEPLQLWLNARLELPVGPLFCIIDGPTRGRAWSGAAAAPSCAGWRRAQVSAVGSRRTSCATPTPSSSPARASR
jgi:hypothetical protein